MQNVVDGVSLRPTETGSTWTDTVVLLHLDRGALECRVCTECVQAHAASAGSRAVMSHGRTCAHQLWVVLQHSAQTESDQGHVVTIQPGRRYSVWDVTDVRDATLPWKLGMCAIDFFISVRFSFWKNSDSVRNKFGSLRFEKHGSVWILQLPTIITIFM